MSMPRRYAPFRRDKSPVSLCTNEGEAGILKGERGGNLQCCLVDDCNGILAMVDGIEDVEDPVAPACNAVDIVLLHGERCLAITHEVEKVELGIGSYLFVSLPCLAELLGVVVIGIVPELAVGEKS